MKKAFLIIYLTVIVSTGFGQTTMQSGTTAEEYNYATKGYVTTLEQSLDIKKGYEVVKLTKDRFHFSNNSQFEIQPLLLKRTGQTASNYAAIMLVFYYSNHAKKAYCIPHPNTQDQTVIDNSYHALENLEGQEKQLYIYTASRLYANIMAAGK